MERRPASNEEEFLAAYDPRRYVPVAVTVDVAVLTIRDGVFSVLLVRRANPPYAGKWCLPGGFLKPGSDGQFSDLPTAAAARLALETGLAAETPSAPPALDRVHLEQLATFGKPGRDPRMHVISVAYLAFAPRLPEPMAGPGTLEAIWMPVAQATLMDLAFDHAKILEVAVARARSKLEYTTLATSFLPDEFSVGALQRVYETVWGEELIDSGFRRKVHSTAGFVEEVGAKTTRHGSKGGRQAQLYRAGSGQQLDPPLLSKTTQAQILADSFELETRL